MNSLVDPVVGQALNLLGDAALSSFNTYRLLFAPFMTEGLREALSARRAAAMFFRARRRVPAYREFLRQQHAARPGRAPRHPPPDPVRGARHLRRQAIRAAERVRAGALGHRHERVDVAGRPLRAEVDRPRREEGDRDVTAAGARPSLRHHWLPAFSQGAGRRRRSRLAALRRLRGGRGRGDDRAAAGGAEPLLPQDHLQLRRLGSGDQHGGRERLRRGASPGADRAAGAGARSVRRARGRADDLPVRSVELLHRERRRPEPAVHRQPAGERLAAPALQHPRPRGGPPLLPPAPAAGRSPRVAGHRRRARLAAAAAAALGTAGARRGLLRLQDHARGPAAGGDARSGAGGAGGELRAAPVRGRPRQQAPRAVARAVGRRAAARALGPARAGAGGARRGEPGLPRVDPHGARRQSSHPEAVAVRAGPAVEPGHPHQEEVHRLRDGELDRRGKEVLRLWFGFTAPVSRRAYLLTGLTLMTVKYLVEVLAVPAVTGTWWTPWEYFSPSLTRIHELQTPALAWGLAYCTLHASLGLATAAVIAAAGVVLLMAFEGALCLLMAFPLALGLALIGAALGRSLALRGHPNRLPILLLLLALPA